MTIGKNKTNGLKKTYNSNLINDSLNAGFSFERIWRFVVWSWGRLVVSRTERNLHQFETQVRSFFRVFEGPQLEGRLRHDLHLPQRVGALEVDGLPFLWDFVGVVGLFGSVFCDAFCRAASVGALQRCVTRTISA